jgi:hypothetical protein
MTPVFYITGRIKYSMKTTGRYLEGKAIECTFLNQLEGKATEASSVISKRLFELIQSYLQFPSSVNSLFNQIHFLYGFDSIIIFFFFCLWMQI